MLTSRCAGCARHPSLVLVVLLGLSAAAALAQPPARTGDALLAIDQHRASVVQHIVSAWGTALAKSPAQISIDELRTRLASLRADALLAASLAGTIDGLREVIGGDDSGAPTTTPAFTQVKALGDSAADVVYTPVTPCRLVETRGTFAAVYQGNGTASHTPLPFTPNQIRSYTLQGGNSVCLTQLPAALNPSAVQLQVFGIPTTSASGDIEILPQGASFGSTATMVYVATIPFNTVSTAAKVNLANNQISVQVRGGGAHLAIDVVGYFAAPNGSGGKFFLRGGNAFGTTATLGTTDNQPLNLNVNGQRVARYEPNATSPNVIGGDATNGADSGSPGQTIAGGGRAGSDCPESPTGPFTRSCANRTANEFSTIGGGYGNQTNGGTATVAGGGLNTADGLGATVGGGNFNTASDTLASVGGGQSNVASGAYATVAGGLFNTASGSYATVAGGSNNTASGTRSFAAGRNAQALADGSFVFGDSTADVVTSNAPNQFIVAASGGIIMATSKALSSGCFMVAGGGTWNCTSDRNAKRDFGVVDPALILARVAALPLSTWRFAGGAGNDRHIGPMAQDFRAAFGLGSDDRTIALVDADGVALTAIQGLNTKLEQQIGEQRAEIGVLRDEVATLKAMMETLHVELREATAR